MTSSSKLNKIVPLVYSELIENIFGRTIFRKNICIIYVKLREIHLLHHSVYENHWWENLIFLSIDLMIFIISGLPDLLKDVDFKIQILAPQQLVMIPAVPPTTTCATSFSS